MFELTIQREFCAAHAIVIAGRREPLHGHNWKVTLVVRGERLDGDGLLCDFHLLEGRLEEILGPLRDRNLNEVPPFDRLNPTAEHVARHIGESMRTSLPPGVTLASCSVTEATGCEATYRPGEPSAISHRPSGDAVPERPYG